MLRNWNGTLCGLYFSHTRYYKDMLDKKVVMQFCPCSATDYSALEFQKYCIKMQIFVSSKGARTPACSIS